MEPESKLSKLKTAFASGDMVSALRIASKFQHLGEQRDAITRAWAAHQSPDFYREINQDPEALFAAGVEALRVRYGL